MDLNPSPEQQAVQEQARRFLAAQVTRERRLVWDASPSGYDDDFWRQVSELGWLGFGSMMGFLFVLTVGFVYEWRKGALDWE